MINILLLPLVLLLLPIPLPVPVPLPTWHQEKRESEGGYEEDLVGPTLLLKPLPLEYKEFGVKHRMQPQNSTGGRVHGDPGPQRHNVLINYTPGL